MNDETDDTNKVEVTNRSTTTPETAPITPSEEPSPAFSPDVEKEELIVPPPAPKEPKKSFGSKKWLVWGVVAVLLVGMGALTYYFYSVSQTEKQRADDATSNIDAANTTVANLRTQLSKALAEEGATTPTTPTTPTDKQVITDQTTAAFKAVIANAKLEPVVTIVKQEVIFARTTAGPPSSGAITTYILKKVNTTWVVIYSGDGDPSQAIVDKYGIPAEIAKAP